MNDPITLFMDILKENGVKENDIKVICFPKSEWYKIVVTKGDERADVEFSRSFAFTNQTKIVHSMLSFAEWYHKPNLPKEWP